MNARSDNKTSLDWVAQGAFIGVAGGLTEVLVVGAYALAAGVDPASVAGAIATAAQIDSGSTVAGLAVHFVLSADVGVALMALATDSGILRHNSPLRAYSAGLLALATVWALNFFIVLPVVSPPFVHLLPYAVTLASKLMFAVAAVATFRSLWANAAPQRKPPAALARSSA